MNEVSAIVVATDGPHAIVRIETASGCGKCHEPGGCGGVSVARALCGKARDWQVLNPRGAQVGDVVRVAIDQGAVSASASLLYVLPLLLLIAGGGLGAWLAAEPGAILGACGGLFLAWRVVRRILSRRYCDSRFQPHII